MVAGPQRPSTAIGYCMVELRLMSLWTTVTSPKTFAPCRPTELKILICPGMAEGLARWETPSIIPLPSEAYSGYIGLETQMILAQYVGGLGPDSSEAMQCPNEGPI